MAQRRKVKPPHKLGDGIGCKRDVIGKRSVRLTFADISIVICHESGKTVTYSQAPKHVKIHLEELDPGETGLQKVR